METANTAKLIGKSPRRTSDGMGLASPSVTETLTETETEAPTNLNGEKEVVQEENSENLDIKEEVENSDEKLSGSSSVESQPQGKKRKLDETKDSECLSDDSNNGFCGFPPQPVKVIDKDSSLINEDILDSKQVPRIPDPIPPESAFGKGKRSRIPNKKYESLGIKSFGKSNFSSLEQGEFDDSPKIIKNGVSKINSAEVTSSLVGRDEEAGDENQHDVSSTAQGSPTVSSRASKARLGNVASPGLPHPKKQKLATDITNPCYLKPLELGWKRELVYRATFDNNLRRNGDVYYYTPSGKKVRSMREVAQNLQNSDLTLDDFTFFKEPVGINDPEKEIIRDAQRKGGGGGGGSRTSHGRKSTPKAKATPKVSTPAATPTSEPVISPPKAGKSPKLGGFKVKVPGSRLSKGSKRSRRLMPKGAESSENEYDMLPAEWLNKKGSSPNKSSAAWQSKSGSNMAMSSPMDSKPCRPCSIRCQGVSGLIPTLQCRLCLCLYHTECAGLGAHSNLTQGYLCKNCHMDNQEKNNITSGHTPAIAPPPLTPISSLKSNNMQSATPPKLQRIPRPIEKSLPPSHAKPTLIPKTIDPAKTQAEPSKAMRNSKFITVPPYAKPSESHSITSQAEPTKSIVGSVTTWFPPSTTIQLNSNNSHPKNPLEAAQAPRPQSITIMGDRKYLIVPKHSILCVSPTIGAALSTPSSRPLSSPTADKAPNILLTDKDKTATNIDIPMLGVPATASMGIPVPPEIPANSSSAIDKETSLPIPTTTITKCVPSEKSEQAATGTPDSSTSGETRNNIPDNREDIAPTGQIFKESPESTPTKPKRGAVTRKASAAATIIKKVDMETVFMQNYLQNLSYGYQTLLYVFQYLKVQDLLRAGCVCTLWRDIAGHPSLWRTVRMKNSQVADWEGLANALKKHSSRNLDLRKMLLPNNSDDMWPLFSKAIARVDSLVRIELCRCPASVVEELAKTNQNLQVINAVTIRCETLDLTTLDNLASLQELRLKSTNGFTLKSDLTPLKNLTELKHLSLTSVKELNKLNVEVIGELVNLESLDLGECNDFPENFGSDIISKLTKLEKLRLEKGQGTCCTFNILDAVSKIESLEQLELVNFDVKAGFDKALAACTNIKKLLIIPTYISQSATTNHMVLGGVIKLKSTLSHFVWGVTLELLRVTELFVDQCDDNKESGGHKKKSNGNGDSIPVLKPVPIMKPEDATKAIEGSPTKEPPQVEILPLPTLQKLLLNSLPTTRVKILKIPFHATWRQSIVDTVN